MEATPAMTADIDIDTVIVGAGVVGLAIAQRLAMRGVEVLVLEAAERAGEGISSRNSGVIHAGMYYPTGSLKARCCVRGAQLLYQYCSERRVAHRRTGKLIVATSADDLEALAALHRRGTANGVELDWLDSPAALRLEPALACVAALDSPQSGIVDVPELITALIGDIEQYGGRLLCRTAVQRIHVGVGRFDLETASGDRLAVRRVINAAGLGATTLAASIDGLDARHVPRLYFGQGHYYSLRGRSPFTRLIYPLPGNASLGVHLGMDISGRCRFGPDMRWIDAPDYHFDDSQRAEFAASIRQWWPSLREHDLSPDFVGVRPKLAGPGEASADFSIQDRSVHGIDGLINLFGIESPGLTSSLALAETVAAALDPG
jgi:L-2-hydroxyglutarate oxidase LhgO